MNNAFIFEKKDTETLNLLNEIAFLYELSLSVGRSLDLKENCMTFLNTLLSRKSFDWCSVWLKEKQFDSSLKIDNESLKKVAFPLYIQPLFEIQDDKMPLNNIIFDILESKEFISISFPNEEFNFLLDNPQITSGTLAIFRLADIGYLKFFTINRKRLNSTFFNQLTQVINKFAIVLKGCLAHRRVMVEVEQRKIAEAAQQRLLEKLSETNQELEDFAYVVSHDLKAPLRGISMVADFLVEDYSAVLDEDGKEDLLLLKNRATKMQSMIDSILHYSRIGFLEEEKKAIDTGELLVGLLDLLTVPTDIEVIIPKKMPTIWVEKTSLMQVFQNLLSNAIKYMDKEKGWIKISFEEKEASIIFCFADNGAGIAAQNQAYIFQLFQTFATSKPVKGTGVGLAVVKKIVGRCKGKIWVESKVGEGSQFFVELPR